MFLPFVLIDIVAAAGPSAFWTRADALCRELPTLELLDATALGPNVDARDELVRYCKFTNPPPFAALPEAERMARLEAIAKTGGLTLPDASLDARALGAAGEKKHVSAADEALRREPAPELGLIGEKILGAALGGLCGTGDAKQVLPATCALGDSPSLGALRIALVRDVLELLLRKIGDDVPESVRALRIALAPNDVRGVDLEAAFANDRLARLSAGIVTRFLVDNAKIDRDKEHYRNIVERVVRDETKDANRKITPDAAAATDELVASLRALDDERLRDAHATTTAVERKALAVLVKTLILAAVLAREIEPANESAVRARAEAIAAATDALLAALERAVLADAKGFVEQLRPTLTEIAKRGKVTESQIRAIDVAARLAQAKNEGDVKAAARAALLPLPPWVDRFAFDINIAPPVSKSAHGNSELSLNGDLTVGYNGDVVGFVAHADSSYYQIERDRNSALTERYAGALDLWVLIALSDVVRLEPRLSAGALYYGTLADDATTSINRQTNQDSIFGRGVGSLGVRVQPGSRFAGGAAFGVGGQYEDYYRVIQTSLGDQGTVFNSATTVRFEGRLRAQVTLVPRILSFRARGDFNFFDMRRADQAVTFSLGKVTAAEQGVTDISQTEIFARAFLDADIARFFGFVPAIHAGANVFIISSNGQSTSDTIPVFGIGIRREAL